MPDPSSPYYPNAVYTSGAIPGWTAYIAGVPQTDILFNDISLSGPAVTLQGFPGSLEPVLQGNYSVFLEGAQYGTTLSAAIGQIGQVPVTAQAMTFYGYNLVNLQVTFNGSMIPYFAVGTGPNYTIYDAGVSALAGQTGQLLFTTPVFGGGVIDNIQFSSVPEPSEFLLAALGALIVGLRRWRNSLRRGP